MRHAQVKKYHAPSPGLAKIVPIHPEIASAFADMGMNALHDAEVFLCS